MQIKRKIMTGLMTLSLVTLFGCSASGGSDIQNAQLEDMDLVVTAQQGRIQNLELQVLDLENKLDATLKKIDDNENAKVDTVDPQMLESLKLENRNLVRLLFQSFDGTVDLDSIKGLIEVYDTVFKLNKSYDESISLIWVTDGNPAGELYALMTDTAAVKKIGVYENVKLTNWAPDNEHVILETEDEGVRKGTLININTGNKLATLKYAGLPIWESNANFFAYLHENPNVVYTGTETAQMYATGVFIYNMNTGRFNTIDPGGNDYLCIDLSVTEMGEIKYIKQFKDGKQSFSSFILR